MSQASTRDARSPRPRNRRRGRPPQRRHRFAAEQIEARQASVPTIRYPDELPVSRRRDDIALPVSGLRQRRAQPSHGIVSRHRDAKQVGRVEERLRADAHRQLREVGVARLHETLVHIDRAVRMLVEHIVANDRAGDLGADAAVPLERTQECRVAERRIFAERRRGGDELERGSRGIKAEACAIDQRLLVILAALGI